MNNDNPKVAVVSGGLREQAEVLKTVKSVLADGNGVDLSAPVAIESGTPQTLVIYPDEFLKRVSVPCVKFGEDLAALGRNLVATMRASNGIGIAAIQVGVPWRAIVMGLDPDAPVFAVNPKIVERSEEVEFVREGCLSFPGLQVPVRRPKEVTVEYQDADGNQRLFCSEGLEARIWQHEIAHLDGRTFLDEISDFRKNETLAKWRKIARKLRR